MIKVPEHVETWPAGLKHTHECVLLGGRVQNARASGTNVHGPLMAYADLDEIDERCSLRFSHPNEVAPGTRGVEAPADEIRTENVHGDPEDRQRHGESQRPLSLALPADATSVDGLGIA